MSTRAFSRARLDGMVDPRQPLLVVTGRLPWTHIEQVLTPGSGDLGTEAGGRAVQASPGESLDCGRPA